MTKRQLIITRATTDDAMKHVMRVRYQVFVDEQGFAAEIEEDEHDTEPTTAHFLGQDPDTLEYVAVARCMVDPVKRKGKIGRVAVLSKCRGHGFGYQIMNGIETLLQDQVDTFALHAQYDKKGFYLKCGYVCPTEEIFLEEGVEHCLMIKKIMQS